MTYLYRNRLRLILLAIGTLYVVWALFFILHSSFVGIDGQRYFSLFDDAMISMRYAENLAHGEGLVWNAGERIEGITNLLTTLLMSISATFFDKKFAVLIIQLSGVPVVLASAFLTALIARHALSAEDKGTEWIQLMVFVGVLAYYPLSFWTLMGMETGLLTFLLLASIYVVLRYGDSPKILLLLPLLLYLSYLTRPDALIPASVILGYRLFQIHRYRRPYSIAFGEMLILAGLVIVHLAFRFHYYGELVPNTYTLKMTGMPIEFRMENGLGFIKIAIKSLAILIALAISGLIASRVSDRRVLLSVLIVVGFMYQIWVGGDPWPYWRMITPFVPLLMILAMDAVYRITTLFFGLCRVKNYSIVFIGLFGYAVFYADRQFLPEQLFVRPIYQVVDNQRNVNFAIALKDVLGPSASVALLFAGTIPYYTGFRAIDILGKCDKWVASLPPDMSGAISWSGMKSVPGHNKYDLNYSVVNKQPTFVESFSWGRQDISSYGQANYVQVSHKGVKMWLRKGSHDVHWEKLLIHGD